MSIASASASGINDQGAEGPGGLFVLIVHSFDESTSAGAKAKVAFVDMVTSLVGKSARLTLRKLDNLADYVVDIEYDILVETTKPFVRKFDKLDMVFVGGDHKELPWTSRSYQLVTLLRMCTIAKKATFCCGGAAFHSMFTLATQGRHLHLVNGPLGENLPRLAAFPTYATSTPRYATGWLDNETGDVYEYVPATKLWRPLCNLGFYRRPTTGAPSQGRVQPPEKVQGRDLRHLQREQPLVEAIEENEEVLQVRNSALHHYALRKLPLPKFVMGLARGWSFNQDGALPASSFPTGSPLSILAEGRRGPVLFGYDCSLLFACDIQGEGVGGPHSLRLLRRVMKNFVKETISLLKADSLAINQSLCALLWGREAGLSGDALAIASKREARAASLSLPRQPVSMAPALAASAVSSSLASGPKKVTVAAIDASDPKDPVGNALRPKAPLPDAVDNVVLTSPRTHKTTGKQVRIALCGPETAREKRLELFLRSQHQEQLSVVAKAAAAAFQAEQKQGQRQVQGQEQGQGQGPLPSSARRLYGDNLAYVGRPVLRSQDPRELKDPEPLLLGNMGGVKWRPSDELPPKRSLTAPLDRAGLRPMSAGAALGSGRWVKEGQDYDPSTGVRREKVPMYNDMSSVCGLPVQPRPQPQPQPQPLPQPQPQPQPQPHPPAALSWGQAMVGRDLYDVYVNVLPAVGSRDQPRVAAVGPRESYSQLATALRDAHVPLRHPSGPARNPAKIEAEAAAAAAAAAADDRKKKKGSKNNGGGKLDMVSAEANGQPSRPQTAGPAPRLSTIEQIRQAERRQRGSMGSAGSVDSLVGLDAPVAQIRKVVVTSGADASKPYNGYKRYEKMAADGLDPRLGPDGDYLGEYTDIYRSALEQEIHDYNVAKKGFVGPPFKAFSGVASAIPLRKEGQIRPMGSYPQPVPGLGGDVLASDWNMGFLQREISDKDRRLAGQWRK